MIVPPDQRLRAKISLIRCLILMMTRSGGSSRWDRRRELAARGQVSKCRHEPADGERPSWLEAVGPLEFAIGEDV
ncbi:hypothetical protein TIFTF001_053818 [Ficus carica]|uniref:Uncharacterized protein n=1 Tax=Ficus carica TaxID=3494 RepID=A0AA88EIY2_FICCA|nr:hypothetical protein TIFTF001_053815 [Ficus carica]GMN74245.1 hypothetical protein TIFTF001_053816 [Ficus carica]GMN74249.1 hypothetical protein TIFTF001_053817 [Ficus carica]GMN74250.1 hypothetical protein TIFTF001_053818 [Ficus carica]